MLHKVPEKFSNKKKYRQNQQCGFVADIEQMRCKKTRINAKSQSSDLVYPSA